MLENKVLKDLSQEKYTYQEFLKALEDYDSRGFNCFIGTDSQIFGKKIDIVTCICFYRENVGSKIFYIKERLSKRKYTSLRAKMLLEAYRSIEAAMEIESLITNKLTIHLDIGSGSKSDTAKYHQELEFLVKSQGYFCEIKPDSWASSSVADRMVKKKKGQSLIP